MPRWRRWPLKTRQRRARVTQQKGEDMRHWTLSASLRRTQQQRREVSEQERREGMRGRVKSLTGPHRLAETPPQASHSTAGAGWPRTGREENQQAKGPGLKAWGCCTLFHLPTASCPAQRPARPGTGEAWAHRGARARRHRSAPRGARG